MKVKRAMMGMMDTTVDAPARRTGKGSLTIVLAALLLALSLGMCSHGAAFAKEEVADAAPVIDISVVLDAPPIVVPVGAPAGACGSSAASFAFEAAPLGPGVVALVADASSGAIDAGTAPAAESVGSLATAAPVHPGCAAGNAS